MILRRLFLRCVRIFGAGQETVARQKKEAALPARSPYRQNGLFCCVLMLKSIGLARGSAAIRHFRYAQRVIASLMSLTAREMLSSSAGL